LFGVSIPTVLRRKERSWKWTRCAVLWGGREGRFGLGQFYVVGLVRLWLVWWVIVAKRPVGSYGRLFQRLIVAPTVIVIFGMLML
jgi:hypothetical protein